MAERRSPIVAFVIAGAGLIAGAMARADSGPAEAACLGETVATEATEVVDARSIRLADGRVLRLAGIEPFGLLLDETEQAEALLRGRLADLVAAGPLRFRLVADAPDRYGRLQAIVSVGKELIQEALVREGLAIAFAGGEAIACFEEILRAEAAARDARRGFWASERLLGSWPASLKSRLGRFAIFEGVVVSVGNRRATTYLNFGNWWSADVTIEIAAEDRELFGGEAALAALEGRRIRARGYIEEKAGPLLVVRSPMQLETLDAAASGAQWIAP